MTGSALRRSLSLEELFARSARRWRRALGQPSPIDHLILVYDTQNLQALR